jgi:hypothetical protein
MVRPGAFGFNRETSASNTFQASATFGDAEVQRRALGEFDCVLEALTGHGIRAWVVEDTQSPRKPDAIFPNNWISFHVDGTVVLYPMEAASRRPERRIGAVLRTINTAGFSISRIVDLSCLETRGHFLEGTGSMVLDRCGQVAYAAISSRTHRAAVAEFGRVTGFETVIFSASDSRGVPVYHTNVMLSIGRRFAVVCADSIANAAERRAVLGRIEATGRDIVAISQRQMRCFAGNLLELGTDPIAPVIALSETAYRALEPSQVARLARHGDIVPIPLPTIERVGGGSVRCMLAEIFLPKVS